MERAAHWTYGKWMLKDKETNPPVYSWHITKPLAHWLPAVASLTHLELHKQHSWLDNRTACYYSLLIVNSTTLWDAGWPPFTATALPVLASHCWPAHRHQARTPCRTLHQWWKLSVISLVTGHAVQRVHLLNIFPQNKCQWLTDKNLWEWFVSQISPCLSLVGDRSTLQH